LGGRSLKNDGIVGMMLSFVYVNENAPEETIFWGELRPESNNSNIVDL